MSTRAKIPPAALRPPAPRPALAPPPAPRSASFLAEQALAFDAALQAAEPHVLANDDPEAVHDLRVALRRLRTLLKLARGVFGGFHTDAVRAEFAELQSASGQLRDEEVLAQTLDGLGLRSPVLDAWRARRAAHEKSLRRGLARRIRSGQVARARGLLRALLTLPVRPDRDAPLPKLARQTVKRARRAVDARRDTPTDDSVGLHDLRIAYKKLRYAVEIFRVALPADLAAMAEPAARFQKRLGDLHDLDVAKLAVARARGLDVSIRQAVLDALEQARAKKLDKYVAEMKPDVASAPSAPPADPRIATKKRALRAG